MLLQKYTLILSALITLKTTAFAAETFNNCEASTAWQILDTENNRKATATIFSEVFDPSKTTEPACQVLALKALARISDPTTFELVDRMLANPNVNVRRAAAFASGLIGNQNILPRLKGRFEMETSPLVLGELARAIARLGSESEVQFLSDHLDDQDPTQKLEGIFEALGFLFLKDSANWKTPQNLIQHLIYHSVVQNDQKSKYASFALARYKGVLNEKLKNNLILAVGLAKNEEARGFLLRALGKLKSAASVKALCEVFKTHPNDMDTKVEVLRGLGVAPLSECSKKVFITSLEDQSLQVKVQALNSSLSLSKELGSEYTQKIKDLYLKTASKWIKEEVAKNLSLADHAFSEAEALKLLNSSEDESKRLGVLFLSSLPARNDLLTLALNIHSQTSVPLVVEVLELLKNIKEDVLAGLPMGLDKVKEDLKVQLNRGDVAVTYQVIDIVLAHNWKEFEPTLQSAYQTLTGADALEGKLAIINALAEIGSVDSKEFLKGLLFEKEVILAKAAAQAIQKLFNEDVSSQIPVSNEEFVTPSVAVINEALSKTFTLKTTKGEIEIKLNPEAPLTSYNFAKLSQAGFYKNIRIHRVVPHFVAQMGDPRGDGFGGPGYAIRDEVSVNSHIEGSVGVATAGKDTGGSQFFFNHGGNYHLDGVYTNFANVLKGMNIVNALEVGDVVLYIHSK